ncbi:MAG: S8 family serine peptidase [Bacteroidota bacterium]
MRDRVLLFAKHPAALFPTDVEAQFIRYLSGKPTGDDWLSQIKPPEPGTIISFPMQDAEGFTFSMIPARTENVSDEAFLQRTKEWNRSNRSKPLAIGSGIVLQATLPNWLAGGANDQSGTGGPGSWPVEADTQAGSGWAFHVLDKQGIMSGAATMEGQQDQVHVAILDTAPTQHAIETAYAEWHWQHPLIESLLWQNSPLQVYPASYADLRGTQDLDLLGHRYIMRDHGLFIAGIIHTLAPQASLHLYEVLNPYGVGSLETIARGLSKALTDIKGPLIINCSFMFGIPVKGSFDPDFPLPADLRDQVADDDMNYSLQDFFNMITGRKDTVVVAAAGNDAHYNNSAAPGTRPAARFPAAFDKVVGVGALPDATSAGSGTYTAATYSNLSDTPAPGSYITLGGEPGPLLGVLGVYIGDFPVYEEPQGCLGFLFGISPRPGHLPRNPRAVIPGRIKYERNTTGWAWWAGTSFATPIVTGILAANHGRPGILDSLTAANAEGLLRLLQTGQTPEGEKVVPVAQG